MTDYIKEGDIVRVIEPGKYSDCVGKVMAVRHWLAPDEMNIEVDLFLIGTVEFHEGDLIRLERPLQSCQVNAS